MKTGHLSRRRAEAMNLDLFRQAIDAPVPAPHNGTPTSVAAAISIEPISGTQRRAIHEWLCGRPDGATRQEIEQGTGVDGSAVRPRVLELIGMGLVRETARTRATTSGRMAVVLEVTGAQP